MTLTEYGASTLGASVVRRRVVLAEIAGFCFGVRRAVEMTAAFRREHAGVK